ncbi:conserved hypothetical protein [Streptomyces viridosporus ATCC 14672]|uniref:Winged helix DNA-binding domain-containing protein n=2 Tax=Streptomyces viridosporus TaxID=67581 RepID=D6A5Q2_STRV1|nr:conserved hypothetical protein [Streptomyces viridosporus ATCC 14672]
MFSCEFPKMSHPSKDLDTLIHPPLGFSLIAALCNLEDVDLRFLADLLEVGDSILSQTLAAMRDAGLVEVHEESAGRRNRTWVGVTDEGRRAFNRHVEALREIIASGT